MRQQKLSEANRKFASRLKAIRLRRGWSQAALAEFLNIPPSRVGNWEAARNGAAPHSIGVLAARLGVSAEFLSGSDDERDAPNEAEPKPPQTLSEPAIAYRTEDRNRRLIGRLNQLTELEFARTEPAILGVIDAVLASRTSPPPVSLANADPVADLAERMARREKAILLRGSKATTPPIVASTPSTPSSEPTQGLGPKSGRASDSEDNSLRSRTTPR